MRSVMNGDVIVLKTVSAWVVWENRELRLGNFKVVFEQNAWRA